MRRFINPVLLWAAHACHADLVRQIQYLKVENQILRSKLPRQFRITPRERQRLIKFGKPLGRALFSLTSIVTKCTWWRWFNGHNWIKGNRPHHPGRPRTPQELEEVVLRIARETGWGYTRILGELKKLHVFNVSRSTVVNILKRAGLETGPRRGEATWDEFIIRHARTIWACDFASKRVLTWKGWRQLFVLLFINVKSRQVWASPSVRRPTRAWTAQQGKRFCQAHAAEANIPQLVLRDRDGKFSRGFDQAIRSCGALAVPLSHCSPNLNAYAERFVQTLEHECLDHFMAFGRRHLDFLIGEFLEYYHTERPHQAVGNVPLAGARVEPVRAGPAERGAVVCRERLGGLLKSYCRRMAA